MMMHHTQLDRRRMIQAVAGGAGTIGLASQLAAADSQRVHHPPRAKRVIQLFMNGGPFQGDFFDPKPLVQKFAGKRPPAANLRTERATAGLLPSPFKYSQHGESGLQVSELLPQLAEHADQLCVLRSMYTDNPNHGPALLLMNNGTITPTVPSMGSWMLYGLGSENANLPGYVVLCPGRPVRFSILWSSAFLPSRYQGSYINHSNLDPRKMIPYLSNQALDERSQRQQLDLVQQLNQRHLRERQRDRRLEARIEAMETAFRMQFEAHEAFDLSRETKQDRESYGQGDFANGCLLARRLAERGVRFVQLYHGNGQPWDTHNEHHKKSRELAGTIDRPIAALLADLKKRGMLEDTLVIWGGEFGRTPTTENGNGRDHNHYGFTVWMAGGGVRGGMSHGETDDFGFKAEQDRVHINDLHATILHLLGLDHERLTYRYAGRDFRLTDVAGRVIKPVLA
jgi:hypothetical protein